MVSSGAGSHGDMVFGLTSGNAMGPSYGVPKAALNALTSAFASELRRDGILVNAVCPGFTATFPGGEQMGARPVKDGAASIVWAATLPNYTAPRAASFATANRCPGEAKDTEGGSPRLPSQLFKSVRAFTTGR